MFDGADLSDAVLAHVRISTPAGADWASVDLAGADLTGATVPGAALLASLDRAVMEGATFVFDEGGEFTTSGLVGKSLVGVSFYGNSASPASLRGTDFTGATLKDVAFADIDLTGANLAAATFDPDYAVTFLSGVTCPDGAPPTDGLYDRESCRL